MSPKSLRRTYRTLEGAHESKQPWSFKFISFTKNLPLHSVLAQTGPLWNWKWNWIFWPKWPLLNICKIVGSIVRFMAVSLSLSTVPSTWGSINICWMNKKSLFLNFFIFFIFRGDQKFIIHAFYFSWVKTNWPTGSCWILLTFNVFIHPWETHFYIIHAPPLPPNGWVWRRLLKHSLSIMSFSFPFECVLYCCPDRQMSSLLGWDSFSYIMMPELLQSKNAVYPF